MDVNLPFIGNYFNTFIIEFKEDPIYDKIPKSGEITPLWGVPPATSF